MQYQFAAFSVSVRASYTWPIEKENEHEGAFVRCGIAILPPTAFGFPGKRHCTVFGGSARIGIQFLYTYVQM